MTLCFVKYLNLAGSIVELLSSNCEQTKEVVKRYYLQHLSNRLSVTQASCEACAIFRQIKHTHTHCVDVT